MDLKFLTPDDRGRRCALRALVVLVTVGVLLLGGGRVAGAAAEAGLDEKLGAVIPDDVQLRDEAGLPVSLRQLIDKPTVLTLNYFRCAGICTPQLNNLVRTINSTASAPGTDYQVVTVSFDPADTAEIAAAKRVNYLKLVTRPFPPSAWRFLTGDEAAIKTLTEAVGFGFARRGDTFVHPGALIILSAQGKVTRYVYGITYLPADLEMAVAEAAQGVVRPSISKVLSFCFSYDPAGRKYVLNVTRVAGAATLLLAGVFALAVLFVRRDRGKIERTSS